MKHICILIFVLVLSCKGENKTSETKTTLEKNEESVPNIFKNVEKSRVVVTLDGMDYHSKVNCSYFGEDHFYFKSDKLETTDTNGDGIVINGHQQDDKMVLTLMVNGVAYSAANLGIQKREFIAMGAGKLFSEDGSASFNATYKVICN